jgi:hypothetical protein
MFSASIFLLSDYHFSVIITVVDRHGTLPAILEHGTRSEPVAQANGCR